MQRDVLLAVVLGAHGLKGEVKVKTFTAAPAALGAYGPLHARDGRRLASAHRGHERVAAAVRGERAVDDNARVADADGAQFRVRAVYLLEGRVLRPRDEY